jgi:hypothetical protein
LALLAIEHSCGNHIDIFDGIRILLCWHVVRFFLGLRTFFNQ